MTMTFLNRLMYRLDNGWIIRRDDEQIFYFEYFDAQIKYIEGMRGE